MLFGSGLEVLPRCCPSLKALRLKLLLHLVHYEHFLPTLQQISVGCASMHGKCTRPRMTP